MIIKFNLNYDADPEIGKWFNTADFRRALALGIDRDQINETFWLGTGTPSSVVPADGNKYNPGPSTGRWATSPQRPTRCSTARTSQEGRRRLPLRRRQGGCGSRS